VQKQETMLQKSTTYVFNIVITSCRYHPIRSLVKMGFHKQLNTALIHF